MGKRLRTEFVICLLSVCPHPRSDPPAAPALRGSQAGSPWPRYPGEGSLGVHSRRKFLSIPGHRSSDPVGGRMGATGRGGRLMPPIPGDAFPSFSLKMAGLCGGAGESRASSPARWGPCATAAPAWGQMPSAGATPGVSVLASSPEPCFYRLVFKPDSFYEEGTRLRAPPSRAAAPLGACTQLMHRLFLGTFGCFLPSICPFIGSLLQILGTANRQDSILAVPPVTGSN